MKTAGTASSKLPSNLDNICGEASELYYQINRDYQADAYACGRVTMEGSFTGGGYPGLREFEPAYSPMDLY